MSVASVTGEVPTYLMDGASELLAFIHRIGREQLEAACFSAVILERLRSRVEAKLRLGASQGRPRAAGLKGGRLASPAPLPKSSGPCAPTGRSAL